MARNSTLRCTAGLLLVVSLLLPALAAASEVPWGRRKTAPREQKALSAFLPFQKAAKAEQVTLGLLQEVATTLERTRRTVERS